MTYDISTGFSNDRSFRPAKIKYAHIPLNVVFYWQQWRREALGSASSELCLACMQIFMLQREAMSCGCAMPHIFRVMSYLPGHASSHHYQNTDDKHTGYGEKML